jgi:hypothetical protein
MNNFCVCGKKIESTSTGCWLKATYDDKGNAISGVCIHGIQFDFKVETKCKYKNNLEICTRNSCGFRCIGEKNCNRCEGENE